MVRLKQNRKQSADSNVPSCVIWFQFKGMRSVNFELKCISWYINTSAHSKQSNSPFKVRLFFHHNQSVSHIDFWLPILPLIPSISINLSDNHLIPLIIFIYSSLFYSWFEGYFLFIPKHFCYWMQAFYGNKMKFFRKKNIHFPLTTDPYNSFIAIPNQQK